MRGYWGSLTTTVIVGIALLVALTGGAAAENIAVDVTVVDQAGDPVEGVELDASWDGGSTTVETLAGGGALFQVPEGEDITITVDHPDYVRNNPYKIRNATVPENETRRVVEIPVSLAGTATVTVEDADGPVEGATVELRDGVTVETVTTDANGVAETERVEQLEYRLIVSHPGYLRESKRIDIDGDVSERVEIERASVTVQFNVTDDHFDPPQAVENARIEIDGDSLTTRETGLRSTDLEVNREYDLNISKDGYDSVDDTLEVGESGMQFNVSIQRTPAVNVEVSSDRVVVEEPTRITATDEYGNPVAGGTVSLNNEEVGETDADGTADVRIPTEGEHKISVRGDGIVSSVTVEGIDPSATDDGTAAGDNETSDNGTDTADNETADDSGPGFGVLAAVVGLLSTIALGRR